MAERVLISGANGFIASHIIETLLQEGYEVIGTVRDPNDTNKVGHLREMQSAGAALTLYATDLTDPDPFGELTREVDYVLHTASPYVLTVDDPRRDLLEPAVKGVRSMLEAHVDSSRVRRVVLTSSVAAVTDEPDASRVLTEDDWNDKSSLTRNPYYFSKTEAERTAWKFVEQRKPRWDLVVLNPAVVIGPSHTAAVNTSNRILLDLLNGKYPAILDLTWGFVDVRDVARAHVLAMKTPDAAGRYLCAAGNRNMREVVNLLRKLGYRHNLPTSGLDSKPGSWLAYLLSYLQPAGVGSYLRTHLGRVPRYDTAKIRRDLGITFRPLEDSIRDALENLEHWEHIKRPRHSRPACNQT